MDGYELHIMSEVGIILKDPVLEQFKANMKAIHEEYQERIATIERGESPWWWGFEIWDICEQAKKRNLDRNGT